jgi:hypothetical protein
VRDTRTAIASTATMNDDDDDNNNTSSCIRSWQLKHLYNAKYQFNQSIENWNMQKSVEKNGPTFLHQHHERKDRTLMILKYKMVRNTIRLAQIFELTDMYA